MAYRRGWVATEGAGWPRRGLGGVQRRLGGHGGWEHQLALSLRALHSWWDTGAHCDGRRPGHPHPPARCEKAASTSGLQLGTPTHLRRHPVRGAHRRRLQTLLRLRLQLPQLGCNPKVRQLDQAFLKGGGRVAVG